MSSFGLAFGRFWFKERADKVDTGWLEGCRG